MVIDEFKRQGIDASFRSIDWSIMLDLRIIMKTVTVIWNDKMAY